MKKIVFLFLSLCFILQVQAAKTVKCDFTDVIKESGVDKDAIAISIKSADNGKIFYSLNDKILMNPASVQKALTLPVIMETLGENYKFKTDIYKRGDNSFVIKLGADPYFSTNDLKTLVSEVDSEANKIYIDDKILDNKTWGEGWQWDDDMNILMPRFGSYNLDGNIIKLTIIPNEFGQIASIVNTSKYPLVFINNITRGDSTELNIHRDSSVSANALTLSGTVARPTTVSIPVPNLKLNFDVQLTRALENRNVYLKENFVSDKLNISDKYLTSIEHSVMSAVDDVLKNSNNMVIETMFKLAGRKHSGLETGTDSSGIKMFNDYCVKNNLDNSRIRITDASGVSKNNLVSADFVSEFLYFNRNNPVMSNLPTPGEGTLTHRMLPIKNNLKAKTGTLSDVSSIAGYLTARSGKKYVFCIMINDMKLSTSDKKMLEDFLIREAYMRL